MQLFRDRSRNESGFFPRLRLWLDLLTDLAVSIPREYAHAQRAAASASANRRFDGTPAFFVLKSDAPSFEALFYGGILSLVVFASSSVVISQRGNHRPMRDWIAQSQRPSISPISALPRDAEVQASKLDAAERQRVINQAAANLKQYYAYPDVARKMADALLAHEKKGDDHAARDGGAFAELLTRQMRDVSRDMHLMVVYSDDILPEQPQNPSPEVLAGYRKTMKQENCTFEQVKILPRNIGFVKLNSFPDPSVCRPTAIAAMASLNHADAVIFDLRDNRGGSPDMVALIAAYLFDHPEYMYNPRESPTQRSWTSSPVPGSRLADKPVYVVTSASTFSGAEQFCYDLKMLKRATLVGETTGGGAHAGVWHRIDDHFGMGIPEIRAVNPFSKADWEGTGVEPDVKVKAANALETAEKIAVSKLQKP